MANTFFKYGNQSFPYYTPSSTTTSSTKTSGAGINVGGFIGNATGGISVGGGKSTTTATTTYAQRIIAIPPMTEKALEEQYLFPEGCEEFYTGVGREHWYWGNYNACINIECKRGEVLSWSYNKSPITCGVLLTYAYDETIETKMGMNIDMYMSQLIGGRLSWENKTYMNDRDFSELPNSIIFFIAEQGKATRGQGIIGRMINSSVTEKGKVR